MKFFSNKKGSLIDTISVPVVILMLTMTAFIGLYVWYSFQDTMAITIADKSYNSTIVTAMDEITISIQTIDYMFPLLVGGLLIVSLILAFKAGSSVLYSFVSIILWMFALVMSVIFSNIFEEFSSHFVGIAGDYSIMTYIMLNMKWLVLSWVVLLSLVMFTRNKQEENLISQQIGGVMA